MNMKYQNGKTSWGTIIFWAALAGIFFGVFDNENGDVDLKQTVTEIKTAVKEIKKELQEKTVREGTRLAEDVETIIQAEPEAPEASLKDMELEYIPNRIRDKSKNLNIPLPADFVPRRHIDGTLWGCKADGSVCYRVSD
jgi:hypothetical protein